MNRGSLVTGHACRLLLFASLFLALPGSLLSQKVFQDPRRKTTVGFSVDLESPLETVEKVVGRVTDDLVIRGSYIFSKETQIDEAEAASSSKAFPDVPPPAKVFYKIKTEALAPAHFPGDRDIGTVTVRYLLEPVSPGRTRLRIDAVFITDGGHFRYPSDGSVETAEYAEIMIQLKALTSPPTPKHRPAESVAAEQQSVGLQNKLAEEETELADAKAVEAKLRERVKQLQFNTQGRVRSPGVPLRSLPYEHSSAILTLEKGATVTVLTTTKYWYRIRTAKGEEGWIYYAFLEPLS
ncbi:MAG TPA: SH3 domain-containing protein [Candidatus Sulfotelmatobacter sp.]|nr:SH3 domain-containing protein [Candidatus Sulfotelmatobacter sp.]